MIESMTDVSVVVPVFLSKAWIKQTLSSMARQSLAPDRFEVILVFNGPDDGAKAMAEEFRAQYPSLNIRIFSSNPASAPIARNAGIEEASGKFITFVDADDWISEHYLELLLEHASFELIPVAQIVDVHPDGRHDYHNRYNSRILGQEKPLADPRQFYLPMSFLASKMFPTSWVKETRFHKNLRSAEDVVFNYSIYARHDFRFTMFPAAVGATYFRRITGSSLSRGDASKDFLVNQRIEALQALADARDMAPARKRSVFSRPMRAQLNFTKKYLDSTTHDEKQVIIDSIVGLGIRGVDWSPLQDEPERLVVSLNFPPVADTSAIVTAKRIRALRKTVDVISGDLSRLREKHPLNTLISSPYIRHHKVVGSKIRYFGSKQEILRFIEDGLETYNAWVAMGADYSEMYSRSMWPHSHFLAAAIKRKNPHLFWEAEFSDPSSVTVEGEKRFHPSVSDEIGAHFRGWGTPEQMTELAAAPYVMRWAELLPYFFADALVMTNRNQLKVMLEHAPPAFRDQIEAKSVVRVHPTLPESFYNIVGSDEIPSSDRINLAYFGDFYKTRGMTDIFQALSGLSDGELDLLSVSIFTGSDVETLKAHIPNRVHPIIKVLPKLEFLEFLSSLKHYDVLIVNDAHTADHFTCNPYLPSKLSDYKGTSTPIWSVVEPGSVLSTISVSYQSRLGDSIGARRVLRRIIKDVTPPGSEISRATLHHRGA